MYSATDYGAKGNGTTDDTAAIQRALDAAEAAGGGVVVLSKGTFIVSGTGEASDGALRIASNVTLAGAGMGDTTIKLRDGNSGDVTGIVRTESSQVTHDVVIRDLTIDGNSAKTKGSVDGIFTGVTPGVALADHDILIQSVEIKNVSRYAFDPHEQTVRLTIVDSYAHDNGRDGFTIDYISESVFVDNISANNGRHGFNVVTSSHHNLMVDNIAYGNAGNGLVTQNGSDLRPWTSDITVVGGEYYANGLSGILVKVSKNVTVYRADVHDNAREGIMISGSVDTRLIDNNVYNNSRSDPGGYQEIRWADLTSGDYVQMTGKSWAVRNVTVADEARTDSGAIDGTTATDIRTGADTDDRLCGGGGNDYLDGGAGNDTAVYEKSIDQFRLIFTSTGKLMVFDMTNKDAGSGIDVLENIENVEFSGVNYTMAELQAREAFSGPAGYQFSGYNSAETFIGGVTDDYIDGRGGADTMVGGFGNDTYVVDNTKDKVVELADAGIDLVIASETTRLSENVENLTLTGGAFGGYGNETDNVITGNDVRNELKGYAGADKLVGLGGDDMLYGYKDNDLLLGGNGRDELLGGAGDDTLDGGAGPDIMRGGIGDDVFYFDDAGDVIVEYNNQGRDKVIALIDAVLADKVEDLELAAGVIRGTGNSFANTIQGNAAANILDGAGGADTMTGGLGDDTYYVDNAGDKVVELDRQGTDSVVATIDYALGDFVENLTLAGKAALSGTGNALANRITGNDADNRLDGGAGNDTLTGGRGDDTYIADSRYDVMVEKAAEGHDQVRANVDFTLGAEVEDLTLTDGALKGTGNELANRLTGTERANTLSGLDGDDKLYGLDGDDTLAGGNGNDLLDGGTGRDSMAGGNGDDTYIVDNAGDTVTENAASGKGGSDKVLASVSFVSSGNIEQITLTGDAAINATGDSVANAIVGNDAANRIDGAGGDDLLTGNGGADTFVFVGRFGKDIITDFEVGRDRLDFSKADIGVDPESIMKQVGDDVVFEFSRSMSLTLLDVNIADLQGYADAII
ncbi:MAG: right-handed parallel beta-helix repeat-containing protein [Rhizobiaceae bacterium]|nr:right-handed parallel beta-helix repeat-containing protein [Rhizobiaceae bacterium]